MKKVVTIIGLLSITCSAFAGISSDMLASTMQNPKVQSALKDTDISQVKVVYDKLGRAAFDFTVVVCGVSISAGNDDKLVYRTTRIDGSIVYFKDGSGDVTTAESTTKDSDCK